MHLTTKSVKRITGYMESLFICLCNPILIVGKHDQKSVFPITFSESLPYGISRIPVQ
jgi:hypothetical protein